MAGGTQSGPPRPGQATPPLSPALGTVAALIGVIAAAALVLLAGLFLAATAGPVRAVMARLAGADRAPRVWRGLEWAFVLACVVLAAAVLAVSVLDG